LNGGGKGESYCEWGHNTMERLSGPGTASY
jgi:hypothetical protein